MVNSIPYMDWSKAFLINIVDYCSQLFVNRSIESFHSALQNQQYNSIFLNPLLEGNFDHSNANTGNPFSLKLIDRVLKCASEAHHLKAINAEFPALYGSRLNGFQLFKSPSHNPSKIDSV